MTIGIYKLSFAGTNKIYIGKSSNIEKRFLEHKSNFKTNRGSPKLQNAYNKYGEPTIEILVECSVNGLAKEELLCIDKYNSITNGYNTLPGDIVDCYGEDSPASRYSNDTYISVLKYLIDGVSSITTIAEVTGVSIQVIRGIAEIQSHKWLKDKFPTEYAALELIYYKSLRKGIGNTYPEIVSPDNITYSVYSLRAFALEHNLLESKLHNVLSGDRNTHKGWHLATFKEKPPYPDLISPEGDVYSIKYGIAKDFAAKYGLTYPLLHRVLTGKQISHKGWKLLEASKK